MKSFACYIIFFLILHVLILLFLREICPMSFFLFFYFDFKISLFALSTMDVSNEAK